MVKGALPARGSSLNKEIQRGAKEETQAHIRPPSTVQTGHMMLT